MNKYQYEALRTNADNSAHVLSRLENPVMNPTPKGGGFRVKGDGEAAEQEATA